MASTGKPLPRLPKKIKILNYEIDIRLASLEEIRDVVSDHEGAEGAWDMDVSTIYLLRGLSLKQKRKVFLHELQRALIDLMAKEDDL